MVVEAIDGLGGLDIIVSNAVSQSEVGADPCEKLCLFSACQGAHVS